MNHILDRKGIEMNKTKHLTQEIASTKAPKLAVPFQISEVLIID